jgi:hypothetical protein
MSKRTGSEPQYGHGERLQGVNTLNDPSPEDAGDRFIDCEYCGGDGEAEFVIGRSPTGPLVRVEKCRHCDGTGLQVVETEAVTLEDLENGRNNDDRR